MGRSLRILFVGESCVAHTLEFKGYDCFTATRYAQSAGIMKGVFEKGGHVFDHIPCHLVFSDFPKDMESLRKYDLVILSDVGSNTMLLHPDTARLCKRTPNLLKLIREYVSEGGGFCMIGGYMTFQGIEAKAKYKDTPIEEILPVQMLPYDDRVEAPEGIELEIDPSSHPILNGLPAKFPYILGYNRLIAKPEAQVVVRNGNDPIISCIEYGKGRTVAYSTDCAPHWAPTELCEWEYYPKLWSNIANWLTKN